MKYTLSLLLIHAFSALLLAECTAGGCGATGCSVGLGSGCALSCGSGYYACCQAGGGCACNSSSSCAGPANEAANLALLRGQITPTESESGIVRLTASPDGKWMFVTLASAELPDRARLAFVIQRINAQKPIPVSTGTRIWFRNSAVLIQPAGGAAPIAFRLNYDDVASPGSVQSAEAVAGVCRWSVDKEQYPPTHGEFVARSMTRLGLSQ